MSNKITTSKTIFLFCLSFVAGIFFAPVSFLLGLIISFLSYFILKNPITTTLCVLFFILGSLNYHHTLYSIPENLDSPLIVRVIDKPTLTNNFTRLKGQHQKGNIYIYTEKYENYSYGDVLKVSGSFTAPEDEGYANYLKKERIYHTVFRPEIVKIDSKPSFFYNNLYSLRQQVRGNITSGISPPQSYLAKAMVLGDRSSFSDDFNEKLSVSGTRHIAAISGMHIVIISSMLFIFFSCLPIKRRYVALCALFCVFLFVVFVGAPASALRAGLMGGVALIGSIVYRKPYSFRLIAIVATAMLFFNPLLLHYDLGFQLSFLAVIGILSLQPVIKKKITEITKKQKNKKKHKIKSFLKRNNFLADLIAVTLSAQIMVSPLVAYNFGHVSVLSIPANVLIVPLLPYIIPLIVLTGVTGFFLFSFASQFLLSIVVLIIEFTAAIPFSVFYLQSFSVYILVIMYTYIFYRIRFFVNV